MSRWTCVRPRRLSAIGPASYPTRMRNKQLWIPAEFVHGFLVLSESANFPYKTTDNYAPAHERCIVWNDLVIGIEWPEADTVQLSAKDQAGDCWPQAQFFA